MTNRMEKMLYELGDSGDEKKYKIYRNVMKGRERKMSKKRTALVAAAMVLILGGTGFAKDIYRSVQEVVFPSGSGVYQDTEVSAIKENIAGVADVLTNRPTKEEEEIKDQSKPELYFHEISEVRENMTFQGLFPAGEMISSMGTFAEEGPFDVIFFYMDTPWGKAYVQERESTPENQTESSYYGELRTAEIDGVTVAIQGHSLETERDGVLIHLSMDTKDPEILTEAYRLLQ